MISLRACDPIPNPPAFVTAAASPGPAATFIPARKIGCLTPKSLVRGVVIVVMFAEESFEVFGFFFGSSRGQEGV